MKLTDPYMKKPTSDLISMIIVAVICLVILLGQSYLYVTKSFKNVLIPMTEFPHFYSYVEDALWEVWVGMLIWPLFLFVFFVAEIIRMWRKKRSQENHGQK